MEKAEGSLMLIDTNLFVDHLRNYAPAVDFFEHLNDASFSAITESELLAGTANNSAEKRDKLLHFLRRWKKISVDNPLVMVAGDLSRNHGIEIPDAIIAASALVHNLELITRNVKDFKDIPHLRVRSPY